MLPKINSCPDSIFVEDISVSTSDFSIITNPPIDSRQKEKAFIEKHLRSHFGKKNSNYPIFHLVETPEEEKTLAFEGGNVIRFGRSHFFVGINRRTNMEGFNKFQKILSQVGKGYTATPIALLNDKLHLKCFVTYLGDGWLIGRKDLINNYREFDGIKIMDTTKYGGLSNVVTVNKHVLINNLAPIELESKLKSFGFRIHRTSNIEFSKVDGDITCRSLII